jgi:hypothetical protein
MKRSSTETFLAWADRDRGKDEPRFVIAIDPDYALEVDQRNGWRDESDAGHDEVVQDELRKVAAKGVNELLMMCFQGRPITNRSLKLSSQRFLAVSQLIVPEMLSATGGIRGKPGPPLSLKDLAKLVGCTTRDLRTHQRRFLKAWGFRVFIDPKRP